MKDGFGGGGGGTPYWGQRPLSPFFQLIMSTYLLCLPTWLYSEGFLLKYCSDTNSAGQLDFSTVGK